MTTQTEALKLALEALKMCRALIRINIERLVPIESPNPWFSRDVDHAITAIREAMAEQPPQRKPLTDEQIWKNDAIMSANSGYGATFETLREVVRAIEATHGIKE